MRRLWGFIWNSGKEEAFWAAFSWIANWFNWQSVVTGVILSSVTAILAWPPKIDPWEFVLLIAFSMGIGIWAANGFLYFLDKFQPQDVGNIRRRSNGTAANSRHADVSPASVEAVDRPSKIRSERLTVSTKLGQGGQSIQCKFTSRIPDALEACCYVIVDLKEWSIPDGQYMNKSKTFTPLKAVVIGTIEPRSAYTKTILSRGRREFMFENAIVGSEAYRVRDNSVWTVTLIVTSKPETILQKDVHFRCVGPRNFELIDDLKSLRKGF